MKQGIHPNWHDDCQVTCSCGHKFTIGSVHPTLQVDICNNCHPFYTGEMKFVDRQGRVDRFLKKVQDAQGRQMGKQQKKAQKQSQSTQPTDDPKSYKELLRDQQTQLKKSAKKDETQQAA